MVYIPLKENVFKEKIGNVIIKKRNSEKQLNTLIVSENYPITLALTAQVEFFNIIPQKMYQLTISSIEPGKNDSEFATVITPKYSEMLLDAKEEYGKTVGMFDFSVTKEKPGDKLIQINLINLSDNNTLVDQFYVYYTFGSKEQL